MNVGDLAEADCVFRRSLGIHEEKAPGSIPEAISRTFLGEAIRQPGGSALEAQHPFFWAPFVLVEDGS
jgi:hypothetical protein